MSEQEQAGDSSHHPVHPPADEREEFDQGPDPEERLIRDVSYRLSFLWDKLRDPLIFAVTGA